MGNQWSLGGLLNMSNIFKLQTPGKRACTIPLCNFMGNAHPRPPPPPPPAPPPPLSSDVPRV